MYALLVTPGDMSGNVGNTLASIETLETAVRQLHYRKDYEYQRLTYKKHGRAAGHYRRTKIYDQPRF